MVKECTLPIDPVLHAVAYAVPPSLLIANAADKLTDRYRKKRKMPILCPLYKTPPVFGA